MDSNYRVAAKIREHEQYIDQPSGAGGENSGPTPLETLLFALAGCISHIARIVAGQKKIDLRAISVDVEGELDTAVLMGKSTTERCGFTYFDAKVSIDADLSPEQKREFLAEVDRRCPVSDNLIRGGKVNVTVAG